MKQLKISSLLILAVVLALSGTMLMAKDREPAAPSRVKAVKSELPLDFDTAAFKEKMRSLESKLQKKVSISAEYAMPYWYFAPDLAAAASPGAAAAEKTAPSAKAPAKAAAPKVPLVVFLHGYVDGGKDLRMVHPQCLNFIAPENQAKNPCFFIAPQLVENPGWWDGLEHIKRPDAKTLHPSEKRAVDKKMMVAPEAHQIALMDLISDLVEDHPEIDRERIVVTGLSSGGWGCYMLMYHFPHHFSAMAPLCAGDPETVEKKLVTKQKVAMWGFYNRDESPEIKNGMDLCLQKVDKLGGEARRTTFDSEKVNGHAAWEWAYAEPQLIPWLFSQKREKPAGVKTRW